MIRVFFVLFLLSFCSCQTKYVPIETVRYDSLMVSKLMKDSIFVRDSVYVKEKGDTIFQYKNKYIYVLKEAVDTMYIYKDREVEVPIPVERKLSWWEKLKVDIGGWVMLIVVIALTMRLVKWMARRLRKE